MALGADAIALVVILFTDAAQIRFRILIKGAAIPARLLGIGKPLTILIGGAIAYLFFDELSFFEHALLAIMLATTDAALRLAVVTSKRVLLRILQSLSVENGLNGGIAAPISAIYARLGSLIEIKTKIQQRPGDACGMGGNSIRRQENRREVMVMVSQPIELMYAKLLLALFSGGHTSITWLWK